jgi:hypothetical protein
MTTFTVRVFTAAELRCPLCKWSPPTVISRLYEPRLTIEIGVSYIPIYPSVYPVRVLRSRDGSVGIVTGYRLEGRVRLSLLYSVQTGSQAHCLLSRRYRGRFPGGKVAEA